MGNQLGFARSAQPTLDEMDKRHKDRCMYQTLRATWQVHTDWLAARGGLADPSHPSVRLHAEGGGNTVNTLYRALEQCDTFYQQAMWKPGSKPESLEDVIKQLEAAERDLANVKMVHAELLNIAKWRPPAAGTSHLGNRLARDEKHLETVVLPGLKKAAEAAKRRKQGTEGDKGLQRRQIEDREAEICRSMEQFAAEHREKVEKLRTAMTLQRSACAKLGITIGTLGDSAATHDARGAILTAIAEDLEAGTDLDVAVDAHLSGGRAEQHDMQVNLTEPSKDDFTSPGRVCEERWKNALNSQLRKHAASVSKKGGDGGGGGGSKRHRAEGYQVLPGMLHSPYMRRQASGNPLFPRLLCQYSTGAGKTFVVYRTLREVLAYNKRYLDGFHAARMEGNEAAMKANADQVQPFTYLCHSEEVVDQVRRSWEINGPEASEWFAYAPNQAAGPSTDGGRAPDLDHKERTASMTILTNKYLFPGLNGTVREEGAKDAFLSFHFPDRRQQDLSEQTDGLVEYSFGPFFLMTFVQFAQVYVGAHTKTRQKEKDAGRRVPLRGEYVVDEAHNLVCPSKASAVHELADEAEYWRVLQSAVQKCNKPNLGLLDRMYARTTIPSGWDNQSASLYLFRRQGGKYTSECRALCLHITLCLLSRDDLARDVTLMSLTATPEKVLGGTLELVTMGLPSEDGNRRLPADLAQLDALLEEVAFPNACILRDKSQVTSIKVGKHTVLEQKSEDGTVLRLMPSGVAAAEKKKSKQQRDDSEEEEEGNEDLTTLEANQAGGGERMTVSFIKDGDKTTDEGYVRVGGDIVRATALEMHRAFLVESVVQGGDAGTWISHPASREQFRNEYFTESGAWRPAAEERYARAVSNSILFVEASGDPRNFPTKPSCTYGSLTITGALQPFTQDRAGASEMLFRSLSANVWADKRRLTDMAALGAAAAARWQVDPFGHHPLGGGKPLVLMKKTSAAAAGGPRPALVPPSDTSNQYAKWQKSVVELCQQGSELMTQAPGTATPYVKEGDDAVARHVEKGGPMWFKQDEAFGTAPAWLKEGAPQDAVVPWSKVYETLPQGNVPVPYKSYGQRKQGYSQESPAQHYADGFGYWPAEYVIKKPGGDKWKPYVRYCETLMDGSLLKGKGAAAAPQPQKEGVSPSKSTRNGKESSSMSAKKKEELERSEETEGVVVAGPSATTRSGKEYSGKSKSEVQREETLRGMKVSELRDEYFEVFGNRGSKLRRKQELIDELINAQQRGGEDDTFKISTPCTPRVSAMVDTVRRSFVHSKAQKIPFWFKWICYFDCPEQSGAGPFMRGCEEAVGTRSPSRTELIAFVDFHAREAAKTKALRTAYNEYVDQCLKLPNAGSNVSETTVEEDRTAAFSALCGCAAELVRLWAGSTADTNLFHEERCVTRAQALSKSDLALDDEPLMKKWHQSTRPQHKVTKPPAVLHAAQSSVGNESRVPEAMQANPARAEQCRFLTSQQRAAVADLFSDSRNNNGEYACVIAVSDWSKEGVDYKMVDGVMADRPLPKQSDFDQLVGRGVRNCSKQPGFEALPHLDFNAEVGAGLDTQIDLKTDPRFQLTPSERWRVAMVTMIARAPNGECTTDALALDRMRANQGERAELAKIVRCCAVNAKLHAPYLSAVGQSCHDGSAPSAIMTQEDEAAFFVPLNAADLQTLKSAAAASEDRTVDEAYARAGELLNGGDTTVLQLRNKLDLRIVCGHAGVVMPRDEPRLTHIKLEELVRRLGGVAIRGQDFPLTPSGLVSYAGEEDQDRSAKAPFSANLIGELQMLLGTQTLPERLLREASRQVGFQRPQTNVEWVERAARDSLWTTSQIQKHLPEAVRLHGTEMIHEILEVPMEAALRGTFLTCVRGVLATKHIRSFLLTQACEEAAEMQRTHSAEKGLAVLTQLEGWARESDDAGVLEAAKDIQSIRVMLMPPRADEKDGVALP